jgi:hypothetical protein
MVELNSVFSRSWHDWFHNSPWVDDVFLANRVPVALSIRYGQDLSILCRPDGLRMERTAWNKHRLWGDLRYVSVALATHIRATLCEEIEDIPFDEVRREIVENRWQVFDSWDSEERNPISIEELEGLPCMDDDRHEIRIYNQKGERIQRIDFFQCEDEDRDAGILVDLKEITSLFDARVMLFPQSYVACMGHVKANDVIKPFHHVLAGLNRYIRDLWGASSLDLLTGQSALQPIGCQFYNLLSHRLAPRSGSQEVQKGDQTAAMASGYRHLSKSCQRAADRLFNWCNTSLPHERHQTLLKTDDLEGPLPKDLRAENVFLIDMHAVPLQKRTGK